MKRLKFTISILLVLASIVYWLSMCDRGELHQILGMCATVSSYGMLCTCGDFIKIAEQLSRRFFE